MVLPHHDQSMQVRAPLVSSTMVPFSIRISCIHDRRRALTRAFDCRQDVGCQNHPTKRAAEMACPVTLVLWDHGGTLGAVSGLIPRGGEILPSSLGPASKRAWPPAA